MAQNKINLKQLYRGYILSFQSLGVRVYGNARNRPLFTHQVISYWAKVGLALGFYPWCEDDRKDLAWYTHDDECVLRLESENVSNKITCTLKKLKSSNEDYKIGILFVGDKSKLDENTLKKQLKGEFKNGEALIITTWWNSKKKESSEDDYTVTGHIVKNGKVKSLQEAGCIWPKFGSLKMIFPKEPNY